MNFVHRTNSKFVGDHFFQFFAIVLANRTALEQIESRQMDFALALFVLTRVFPVVLFVHFVGRKDFASRFMDRGEKFFLVFVDDRTNFMLEFDLAAVLASACLLCGVLRSHRRTPDRAILPQNERAGETPAPRTAGRVEHPLAGRPRPSFFNLLFANTLIASSSSPNEPKPTTPSDRGAPRFTVSRTATSR